MSGLWLTKAQTPNQGKNFLILYIITGNLVKLLEDLFTHNMVLIVPISVCMGYN